MRKHDYTDLVIAGGSILFFNIVLPLLDNLVGMATSAINKTINSWQLDMQLDQASAEVQANQIGGHDCTRAIGFAIPSEPMEDYDE